MDFHVAVFTGIVEIAVRFVEEFVAHWYTDSRHHVEAWGVLGIPGCACVTTSGCDPNLRNQPWSHGLTLLRSAAVSEPHWVLTYDFLNLSDRMVQHLLKSYHKVHRVEVINIMMSVPREASAAWDHEPYVLVDVQLVVRGPEVTRATMLVLCQIGTDMLTRKISVKSHVLATHLIVLQRYNKSIA